MTNPFLGAEAVVSALRPDDPIYLLSAEAATQAARDAVRVFPGNVAYAVKVCDRPEVLTAIAAGGVSHWDVASIQEIRTVRGLMPEATLHYMNPVKAAGHIAEAYGLGVRTFAFDCERELVKIVENTGGDRTVVPTVRITVPNDKAKFPLDRKFGCSEDEAARLMHLAATKGYRCGVTFHVGSQCEDADAYRVATEAACRTARKAGVQPAVIDIGGGFPAFYRGDEPSFAACVAAAKSALETWLPHYRGMFQCEPGRALAASSASVLVRVELRKGQGLFLNDGYYGLLSELRWMPGMHPVRMIRPGARSRGPLAPFAFYGPTCDSIDALEGPYLLPADIDEGDWIEIGLLGAYSTVLASRFNGFPEARTVAVETARHLHAAA